MAASQQLGSMKVLLLLLCQKPLFLRGKNRNRDFSLPLQVTLVSEIANFKIASQHVLLYLLKEIYSKLFSVAACIAVAPDAILIKFTFVLYFCQPRFTDVGISLQLGAF